jgi:hypothetical protein
MEMEQLEANFAEKLAQLTVALATETTARNEVGKSMEKDLQLKKYFKLERKMGVKITEIEERIGKELATSTEKRSISMCKARHIAITLAQPLAITIKIIQVA